MSDLVLRENRNGAAILTLNRPEKLNALSKDMIERLEEHVDAIERETKTIGLVILRGAGGSSGNSPSVSPVVSASPSPHGPVPSPSPSSSARSPALDVP